MLCGPVPLGSLACWSSSLSRHSTDKDANEKRSNLVERTVARSAYATMADLHNTPIVIDNGSGTIRAGYAGEDQPKCFFPSFVGRPKHLRVLAGGLEGEVFIGNRAQELRGLLKIRYPLEHGVVTDWDDMERIWQYIYTEELKTLSEEVC